jgi:predicted TIM-barrel fold metal-dependent hydrolase
MKVDYQSHWYPRSYLDSIEGREDGVPRTERTSEGLLYEGLRGDRRMLASKFYELDEHFADMDAAGIDVMVCSPNMVGEVTAIALDEARHTCELLNSEMSKAQHDHPDRFVGLAMLPLQDVDASIAVLDQAIEELELRGVCILSHVDGRPIADERTMPVYRRIEQHGVPIFLHPAHRSSVYRDGQPRPIEAGFNWMYDTGFAALSLIYSGTLDACPGLRVVHPHLGGTLPYIIGRVGSTTRRKGAVAEDLPSIEMPVAQYLRERFYADSVSQTPGAVRLAIETYGVERILLATDFPWQSRPDRLSFLRELLDDEQAEAIFERNSPEGLLLPQITRQATAGE